MKNTEKGLIAPLLIIGAMYAVLGFSMGIDAFFIPFVKKAFNVSTTMSYLILTATFLAYVIFGAPSGWIINRFGYKLSIVIAFVLIASGFCGIGFASERVSFLIFLVALFVIGMGQTLLTGAINSYVTILGPQESAARRICMMGIADKLAFAAASLIMAGFMDLGNVRLSDVIMPFYGIAVLLAGIAFLSFFSPLPELAAEGEVSEFNGPGEAAFSKNTVLQYPHLILGILAIFFDVGVEIIALGTINDYAAILNLPSPENFVWYTSFAMVTGYLLGTALIPKIISQQTALMLSAVSGLVLTITIVLLPVHLSIIGVAALGFANSLLWPAIFPLALADLGKLTKTGSSLLVMGIIGGAVLPLLFGYFADRFSYQNAYLICLPSYLFIFYYAVSGSRIRTLRPIPEILPDI